MCKFLFKNSNNLLNKYMYFNSIFFRRAFLTDFLKYIWIGIFFNISYHKNLLNFTFLNYINLIESLFGYKPSFKQIHVTLYNNKKLLKFMKKKKIFTLNFKFFLYLDLNNFVLFNFLHYFFSLMELYKKFNHYFKLKSGECTVALKYKKRDLVIYKFFNTHLFLNVFYSRYVENSCLIKNNIILYLYFYGCYPLKEFNFLKKYL